MISPYFTVNPAANFTVHTISRNNTSFFWQKSPQSYEITPKGKKITTLVNPEDYGMDQNSDDSTDDESAPKKPIPSWAEGNISFKPIAHQKLLRKCNRKSEFI